MTELHDIDVASRRMRRSKSWIYHNLRKLRYTQTCPGGRVFFTDEQIEANIAAAARGPVEKPQPQRAAKPKPAPRPAVPAVADGSVVTFPVFVPRPEAARGGRKKRRSA